MRLTFLEYLGKGRGLCEALVRAGHTFTNDLEQADILFSHTDAPWRPTELEYMQRASERRIPVVLYPHGAHPSVEYDGLQEVSEFVTDKLVSGPGHEEVMRRIGYPRPVHRIGWSYCPILPFCPIRKPKKVLFAPLHPWADGKTIRDFDLLGNRLVFEELVGNLPAGSELHVRYFGEMEPNGLSDREGVHFYPITDLTVDWKQIDEMDLVVSCGTFAYLSVARGKPVIFMNQRAPGVNDEGTKEVNTWDSYGDYLRYPVDMQDWPLPILISKVCEGGSWLERWRNLFVGEQISPTRLNRILSKIAGIPKREAKRLRRKKVRR